jgi:hypothetical protein
MLDVGVCERIEFNKKGESNDYVGHGRSNAVRTYVKYVMCDNTIK